MPTLFETWLHFDHYYQRLKSALDQTLQQHYQISLTEFYLLHALVTAEPDRCQLTELVPKVGLSQSATSRLVTRLTHFPSGALVTKYAGTTDKRATYIRLTPAGQVRYQQLQVLIDQTLQTQLTATDQARIAALLQLDL